MFIIGHCLYFQFMYYLECPLRKKKLKLIDGTLRMFYVMTEELYGIEACTANLHSLIHLTNFVQLWGPLWTRSLFGFESMNDHVRKYFHGTQQILDQLAFSVKAEQSIFLKTQQLSEAEKKFFPGCKSYSAPSRFEAKFKRMSLSSRIHRLIEQYFGRKLRNHHSITSHYRFGSTVYTSELFGEGKSRHSSSCIFRHINGNIVAE